MKLIRLTGYDGTYILVAASEIIEVDSYIDNKYPDITYQSRVWRRVFDDPLYVKEHISQIAEQLTASPNL